MKKREKRVQVLFSEDEMAALKKAADIEGLKPAVFLRTKGLAAVNRDG